MEKLHYSRPFRMLLHFKDCQEITLFPTSGDGDKNIMPSYVGDKESYANLKADLSNDLSVIAGHIRIDAGLDITLNDISIVFKRNGVATKKLCLSYILPTSQFIGSAIELPLCDLPIDGKTEIIVSAPMKAYVNVSLFPSHIITTKDEHTVLESGFDFEALYVAFEKSIKKQYYHEALTLKNKTGSPQDISLRLNKDDEIICDNKNIVLETDKQKYASNEIICFAKAVVSDEVYHTAIATLHTGNFAGDEYSEPMYFLPALGQIQRKIINLSVKVSLSSSMIEDRFFSMTVLPRSELTLFVNKQSAPKPAAFMKSPFDGFSDCKTWTTLTLTQ